MLLLAAWHRAFLPIGSRAARCEDSARGIEHVVREFGDVFASYFKKKGIGPMLAYVLLYRFGEGLLEKLKPLFLLDARAAGGLGLDNVAVGNINGAFGSAAFMLGALIGGAIASRAGLKKSMMFFCVMLNVPNLAYIYLSYALPSNIHWITVVFVIEKLGYGIGSVALMLYMMQQIAPGKYKTAHYAISTGFMALCMMVTGMASGAIQEAVGYQWFFIIVMIATIPSFVMTRLAPFPVEQDKEKGESG